VRHCGNLVREGEKIKKEYEMTKYIRDKPWSNNEYRRKTLLPTMEEMDLGGM